MMRRALPALAGLLTAACSPTGIANLLTRPGEATERTGLAYGPLPQHRLDLYVPNGAKALLVFFYGGSWQQGSRGDYAFLGRALAARGYAVAIPDYRLWPAAGWPGFVEDAALATAWAQSAPEAPRLPVFVMGHSAGGFLAASLALDPRWMGEAGRSRLAGGVLMAAPILWQPRRGTLVEIFAAAPGGRIEAVPDPAMLAGAPPLLLLHGGADTVVQPVQSERLEAALRGAGRTVRLLVFDGIGHIGLITPLVPSARFLGLAGAPVGEEIDRFVTAFA
jgi:acetyl esterase/lipase